MGNYERQAYVTHLIASAGDEGMAAMPLRWHRELSNLRIESRFHQGGGIDFLVIGSIQVRNIGTASVQVDCFKFWTDNGTYHRTSHYSDTFKARIEKLDIVLYMQACSVLNDRSSHLARNLFHYLFVGSYEEVCLEEIPENQWLRNSAPGYWAFWMRQAEQRGKETVENVLTV